MRLPLQISFRNMPHSEALETVIRKHAERLDRYFERIMGCRVVVETRHRRHQGNLYHVRLDLTVPGGEIVVRREPALHRAYEDVYVAVRDAFQAGRRKLEDLVRRRDRRIKFHEEPARGRVVRLDPANEYGFIETADGREIYFHRNSLVSRDFGRLALGDPVRFHEEAGEKGPQASTVHLSGRRSATA